MEEEISPRVQSSLQAIFKSWRSVQPASFLGVADRTDFGTGEGSRTPAIRAIHRDQC